jgi:hypothetical protein
MNYVLIWVLLAGPASLTGTVEVRDQISCQRAAGQLSAEFAARSAGAFAYVCVDRTVSLPHWRGKRMTPGQAPQ